MLAKELWKTNNRVRVFSWKRRWEEGYHRPTDLAILGKIMISLYRLGWSTMMD